MFYQVDGGRSPTGQPGLGGKGISTTARGSSSITRQKCLDICPSQCNNFIRKNRANGNNTCLFRTDPFDKYSRGFQNNKGEKQSLREEANDYKESNSKGASNTISPNSVNQGTSNSSIAQVRKKKKKMALYAMLGLGTTAYFIHKARTCSSGCGWWYALAAVAGAQSIAMLKKRSELQKTQDDLCIGEGHCDIQAKPEEEIDCEAENIEDWCPKDTPEEECIETCKVAKEEYQKEKKRKEKKEREKEEDEECPIDDPDCDSNNEDTMTGKNPLGLSAFTGNIDSGKAFQKRLSEIFKPKEGWPNGENPFLNSENIDFNKMPKDIKNHLDNLNRQRQGFMNNNGLGSGSGFNQDFDGDSDNEGLLGDDSSKGGASANFKAGSDDGSRSITGFAGNSDPSPRRSSSLAEQMKNMLKKMHNRKNKDDFRYLDNEAFRTGFGLREDNIFHIVHRMNRRLEEDRRFIPTISF